MIRVPLDRVHPSPWQPREGLDELYVKERAASIHARAATKPDTSGLLQLPAVWLIEADGTPVADDISTLDGDLSDLLRSTNRFVQLAYGHNRFAAFRHLTIHCWSV